MKGIIDIKSGVEQFIFDTEEDTKEIIAEMNEIVDQYGTASLADLCNLIDMNSMYSFHKYGWTSFANATVSKSQYGYFITGPELIKFK